MREYIVRVIAAALICGIVSALMEKKGTAAALAKMLCGIFLAVTVLSPIKSLRLMDLASMAESISRDSTAAAAVGEEMAADAQRSFIKEHARSYILDKAASLQLDIQVEVTLTDEPPYNLASVTLRGSASPYAKARLAAAIEQDLGIGKEDQYWI